MTYIHTTPNYLKSCLKNAISAAIHAPEIDMTKEFFSRNRKLPAEELLKLLISMNGGSLAKELHDAGISVTPSAFSQRRKQLPPFLMEHILERFNDGCRDVKKYRGYRVLAVDGTAVNIPRNPKAKSFMQSEANPKGYNQLHANPLYDVLNKTYVHCVVQPQPKQDEIGALLFMLQWYDFKEKTLIVADRGYESYNLFATLQEKPNVDFLIRVKQNKTAMREVAKLPMTELDRDISFTITTTQRKEDKQNDYILLQVHKYNDRTYSGNTRNARWDHPSPYPMKLRIVRFLLPSGEYETIATSLPRSISAQEIKAIYHSRWGIETAFRELKYSLGLVNLHGKSDEFATQEIYAAMIMSNFCSRIAGDIALKSDKNLVYAYAVNMKMAVYLCKDFFRTEHADSKKLIADIMKHTVPIRPGRSDQRNLKPKGFVGFIYRVAA